MGFEGREQTASACFVNSVEDNMHSILEFNKTEGLIFKAGSGSGVNISSLRSQYESLSSGGYSSGALSFMKVSDANAGSIKSGGATRRAAKMVIMNIDHPEIVDFIQCKVKEEEKAYALIREGYDPSYNGEAYSTIAFQNANNSVRVTDEFINLVRNKKPYWTKFVTNGKKFKQYNAHEIMNLIAEATWKTGDPGLQFHDHINKMNTCKTDECVASNPCGEYCSWQNTACNLASINLIRFLNKENGLFLVDDFVHTVWILSTAMDVWIDKSDYPTQKISEETKKFRTIGVGYSNLGSLIMSQGWAYDSDTAREVASAITSLMTSTAYSRSAEHCKTMKPFPKWNGNETSMIDVLKEHLSSTKNIEKNSFNGEIVKRATKTWQNAISVGEKSGFRNSFVTVLAPTGTISLAMDCDTTGCEPALGLITYKLLAGSDISLEMVNETVNSALIKLGYCEDDIKSIREYIKANNSIEGCDFLSKDHLSVFDTALKGKGSRSISHLGHLKMLAAIQPFISGAISKTINMSNECTVEEIADAYMTAWEMGIKCVAIYRDGSKGSQPLTTIKQKRSRATRVRLPDDVESIRHKFTINGMDIIIQCGLYPDGSLGEIFVTGCQQGSTMRGLLDCWAITMSMSLQYGIPLKELIKKFVNTQFEPHGFTGKADIVFCSSIVDYIVRFLAIKFLDEKERKSIGVNGPKQNENPSINKNEAKEIDDSIGSTSGTLCDICGSPMNDNGSCKICIRCGNTTGCS